MKMGLLQLEGNSPFFVRQKRKKEIL